MPNENKNMLMIGIDTPDLSLDPHTWRLEALSPGLDRLLPFTVNPVPCLTSFTNTRLLSSFAFSTCTSFFFFVFILSIFQRELKIRISNYQCNFESPNRRKDIEIFRNIIIIINNYYYYNNYYCTRNATSA